MPAERAVAWLRALRETWLRDLASARSKVGVATTAQLVWILAPRLPEPEGVANPEW